MRRTFASAWRAASARTLVSSGVFGSTTCSWYRSITSTPSARRLASHAARRDIARPSGTHLPPGRRSPPFVATSTSDASPPHRRSASAIRRSLCPSRYRRGGRSRRCRAPGRRRPTRRESPRWTGVVAIAQRRQPHASEPNAGHAKGNAAPASVRQAHALGIRAARGGAVPICRQSSPGRALRPTGVVAAGTAVYRDRALERRVVPHSCAHVTARTDVTEAVMNRLNSMLLALTLAVSVAPHSAHKLGLRCTGRSRRGSTASAS